MTRGNVTGQEPITGYDGPSSRSHRNGPGTGGILLDPPRGRAVGGAYLDLLLGLYFVAGFALVFTQADRFLWGRGWLPVRPTLLFMLLVAPLAGMVLLQAAVRRDAAARLLAAGARNVALVAPFLALVAFTLLAGMLPTANWSGHGTYVLLVPYDCAVFLAAMLLPLLPPVRRSVPAAGAVCVLLLTLTVYWDAVAPGAFSRIASRAAGLARDPNQAAFLIVLALGFTLSYRRVRRRDLLLLALAAVALVATFSRAGMLMFALLLVVYGGFIASSGGRRAVPWRSLVPVAVAGGLVLAGVVAAISLGQQREGIFSLEANQDRLDMFTGQESFFAAREERLDLVKFFGQKIVESPVLGHGAGYTYTQKQGPHNRYLQEWVNAGLPGFLAYVAFLGGAVWTFHRRRFPAGVAVALTVAAGSLFSHGILEQRAVPVTLGLLATLSLGPALRRVPRRERVAMPRPLAEAAAR